MERNEEVQRRYTDALDQLIEKVKQDPNILAAILVGSLSYDVVWEKSDIDLLFITQETRQKFDSYYLIENGVIIHANMTTRSQFRRTLEGAVQSSFMHSLLMKGRILFTRDETIQELFDNREHLGARDREIRLMESATFVKLMLDKAEKWFHVRNDLNYSFLWIMKTLDGLATIELLLNGQITDREVVPKALPYNPAFFNTVYVDLINQPKSPERIAACLQTIHAYLKERIPLLFRPIFAYLAEAGGIRSAREIDHYFSNQMNVRSAPLACEWLSELGYITKVAGPLRLTDKSRVDVEEAAYYYEGEEVQ